jgi:peptidase E
MTKFILHGGFIRKNSELNTEFLRELVKDVPENGNVLMVYFANETEEEIPEKFQAHIKMFQDKVPEKKVLLSTATKENFIEEIAKSDAVLINGGDTRKLINILQAYPDLRQAMNGKTIAGSSAGAYALAAYGGAHSENQVREGLGYVPVRVICHFESLDLPPNAESLQLLENTRPDLELVYLKDFEWKVFNIS